MQVDLFDAVFSAMQSAVLKLNGVLRLENWESAVTPPSLETKVPTWGIN